MYIFLMFLANCHLLYSGLKSRGEDCKLLKSRFSDFVGKHQWTIKDFKYFWVSVYVEVVLFYFRDSKKSYNIHFTDVRLERTFRIMHALWNLWELSIVFISMANYKVILKSVINSYLSIKHLSGLLQNSGVLKRINISIS